MVFKEDIFPDQIYLLFSALKGSKLANSKQEFIIQYNIKMS